MALVERLAPLQFLQQLPRRVARSDVVELAGCRQRTPPEPRSCTDSTGCRHDLAVRRHRLDARDGAAICAAACPAFSGPAAKTRPADATRRRTRITVSGRPEPRQSPARTRLVRRASARLSR